MTCYCNPKCSYSSGTVLINPKSFYFKLKLLFSVAWTSYSGLLMTAHEIVFFDSNGDIQYLLSVLSSLRENPHQESLYSARQGFHSIQEPSQESFCGLPPSFYQSPIQSPLSPTKTQDSRETSPMSVPNLPSISSMCQPTMFNYERPKHFIQSKNVCQGQQQPPGPAASTESSKQIKQSSILIQPRNPSGQKFSSSSSLSSSITLSSPSCSAPKESTYPVTPASAQSPASSSSGQRLISTPNQPPAAFLCSVLPSQPGYNSQTPSPMEPQ